MVASGCRFILSDWFFICIQMILYVPLSWVRQIKNFGFTALIGDVIILGSLTYIVAFDSVVIGENGIHPIDFINTQSFPLFIGTAMFAYEGIW